MSRPSPRPRPTPRPRPHAAATAEAAADPAASTPAPPQPAPTGLSAASAPDGPGDPGPADAPVLPVGSRPTRTARREQAQRRRRADRRRGWLAGGAALLVVVVALVVAVTVIRRNQVDATPVRDPAATRLYSATSAVLADQNAAQAFVAGATSDIAAVTSYDYRDLDAALTTGLAVTTGQYRTAYRTAITGDLGAAARSGKLVQSFELLRAGIGAMSADGRSATVLIFGIETLTSLAPGGATRTTPTTLTALVVRQGDRYLISRLEVGVNAGLPPGSPQLAVAAEAGRRQVVNLLSYRRSAFDQDLQRALDGAVDPLRSTIEAGADDTRAALTKGRYDLNGAVTAVAIESATGSSVVMLVAATGSRVAADGSSSVDDDARVEVTVVRVSGTWKVSDVQPVAA